MAKLRISNLNYRLNEENAQNVVKGFYQPSFYTSSDSMLNEYEETDKEEDTVSVRKWSIVFMSFSFLAYLRFGNTPFSQMS
mmetsp:Transcript_1091/g.970  ORF Transcript_1091/g.970 Transcript_1091/m.970 type:complete len:81 (+) Transcript_1091:786-1028(+)